MERSSPSFLMPALIGGAALGVLAAIPGVEYLNCLCCSLVISAGFLASFLYSRQCRTTNTSFGAGNGALVGLLAGVFYAVFNGIVAWAIGMATGGGLGLDEIIEQIESNPQIPPETAEMLISFLQSGGLVVLILMSAIVSLIFATIGGLIGGAVFKVEPVAPAAPPVE